MRIDRTITYRIGEEVYTKDITVDIKSDEYGYFEIDYSECEDDYIEGGLWIEDGVVVDYDGCYMLPNEVVEILEKDFKLDCDEVKDYE